MRDRVEPHPPGIGDQGEDELARVEDRRHRTAEHRRPAVLARLPERQPARRPLLLHPPVEGIIEVRRVPEGELPATEEDPAVAGDDQGCEARQADGAGRPPASSLRPG